MNCYKLLYILLLCLFVSCDTEEITRTIEDVEYNTPYEDTSTFIKNLSSCSNVTINIGSKEYVVPKYSIFARNGDRIFRPVYRTPEIAFTNKETILTLCVNHQLLADYGEMDVLLARKTIASNNWEIKKIFQTDSIHGRAMCPALVVDMNTNRIYLMVNYFKYIDVYGSSHSPDDVDLVLKYSDDDGITWSKEYSIKQCWNSFFAQSQGVLSLFGDTDHSISDASGTIWSRYSAFPSPPSTLLYLSCGPKGLSLDDGSLLIPSCVIVDGVWHSLLLIRKDGSWYYSQPTPNPGDNECTAYLDNDDHIILDCRTEKLTRRQYYYDIASNSFTEISPSIIESYAQVSTEIIRDNGLFYMCFPDTPDNTRRDISFYGSRDGILWKKIFVFYPGNTDAYGYTSLALTQEKLLVAYEAPEGISVLDLSSCLDAIRRCILNE